MVVDDKHSNHLAFAAVLEEECELSFRVVGSRRIKLLETGSRSTSC
jgi:hypothetical protein